MDGLKTLQLRLEGILRSLPGLRNEKLITRRDEIAFSSKLSSIRERVLERIKKGPLQPESPFADAPRTIPSGGEGGSPSLAEQVTAAISTIEANPSSAADTNAVPPGAIPFGYPWWIPQSGG